MTVFIWEYDPVDHPGGVVALCGLCGAQVRGRYCSAEYADCVTIMVGACCLPAHRRWVRADVEAAALPAAVQVAHTQVGGPGRVLDLLDGWEGALLELLAFAAEQGIAS